MHITPGVVHNLGEDVVFLGFASPVHKQLQNSYSNRTRRIATQGIVVSCPCNIYVSTLGSR